MEFRGFSSSVLVVDKRRLELDLKLLVSSDILQKFGG